MRRSRSPTARPTFETTDSDHTGATVRSLLEKATERLRSELAAAPAYTADTPYLDALILLGLAMSAPRETVLASLPDPVDPEAIARFDALVAQRAAGNPISYITGIREFYGRDFHVGEDVLIPRPETELIVELAVNDIDRRGPGETRVHDVCTGSGCIGISIALERLSARVMLSDVSMSAIGVARRNATAHGASIALVHSDLLDALPESDRFDIITANPPYLTDNEYGALAAAGWPEPEIALAAGDDGLCIVRRLVRQAATRLEHGGMLVMEIGAGQSADVTQMMSESGFRDVERHEDLAGHERVITGRRW